AHVYCSLLYMLVSPNISYELAAVQINRGNSAWFRRISPSPTDQQLRFLWAGTATRLVAPIPVPLRRPCRSSAACGLNEHTHSMRFDHRSSCQKFPSCSSSPCLDAPRLLSFLLLETKNLE